MALPNPKKSSHDDKHHQQLTKDERRKWLSEWKKELDTIRKDKVEWQKELRDRESLSHLA